MSARRGVRAVHAAAALAAGALLVGGAHSGVPAAAGAVAESAFPERLLLTADEWDLTVSRTKLAPGPVIVELYNRGEDPHDVRIKRRGSRKRVGIPETPSGGLSRIETKLRPESRYRLWCSLPAHRELGMKAKLRTTAGSSRG